MESGGINGKPSEADVETGRLILRKYWIRFRKKLYKPSRLITFLMNSYYERGIPTAITFYELSNVKETADATYKGGLNVMQVAFRTEVAAKAISNIRKNFDKIFVGAGTVLTHQQVLQAKRAGAQFGLSPGFNPIVLSK